MNDQLRLDEIGKRPPNVDGLFFDLVACLDRSVSPTDTDSWGRLCDRSLQKFYRLCGVDHSETQSLRLKDQFRSFYFDLKRLGLTDRCKLNIGGGSVFFSIQGHFTRIGFDHQSLSRYYVSLETIPFLPIGWLTTFRQAGFLQENESVPIATSSASNVRSIRRVRDWDYTLWSAITDRLRRFRRCYRPSRYAYRSRSAAQYTLQADLAMITRRSRRKRGFLKCPHFLPPFVLDKMFVSDDLSQTHKDNLLAVRLTLKQRFAVRFDRCRDFAKLTRYEETYRPYVVNPAHSRTLITKVSLVDSLATLFNYLNFMDFEWRIQTNDEHWFPFERWTKQLLFAANLIERFKRQRRKESGLSRR